MDIICPLPLFGIHLFSACIKILQLQKYSPGFIIPHLERGMFRLLSQKIIDTATFPNLHSYTQTNLFTYCFTEWLWVWRGTHVCGSAADRSSKHRVYRSSCNRLIIIHTEYTIQDEYISLFLYWKIPPKTRRVQYISYRRKNEKKWGEGGQQQWCERRTQERRVEDVYTCHHSYRVRRQRTT